MRLIIDDSPILPAEFSIIATMRMPEAPLPLQWDLFKIADGHIQYRLVVDGSNRSIRFTVSDNNKYEIIRAEFKNLSTIFNTEWHKIGVQVEESSVSLFVDCAKMETVQLDLGMGIIQDFRGVVGGPDTNPQQSLRNLHAKWRRHKSRNGSS